MIEISHPTQNILGEIHISGSKSESNRWLILNALSGNKISIQNLSNSKDTLVLQQALNSDNKEINIGHAGTAMRFLTAFYSIQDKKEIILTGSDRMQERPIGPLVNALNSIGADISYLNKVGYPPILIKGQKNIQNSVKIEANISSQYITALMLIASFLPNGLTINFDGELTSKPYVEMTKSQLESVGVSVNWIENGISIEPKNNWEKQKAVVESDWSSASYWYSIVALSNHSELSLKHFKQNSIQGDSVLMGIYEKYFGVKTEFNQDKIKLSKINDFSYPDFFELNLNHSPDIAQTIIVTCAGLGIKAKLTGLHTLKIKETDRLLALKNELEKIGVNTLITDDSIEIISFQKINNVPEIETYQDHRMAMSFAPLSLKNPIRIQDENVVIKSYPNFWNDLEKTGFKINPEL